jgi:hypothetical protein
MPANEERLTASLVAKRDIMLKIALDTKEEERLELRLTLSTSMQKKTRCTREAKPKEAG